jgi:hypothetical protein
VVGQGEHLGPAGELGGERNGFESHLVVGVAVEGKVAQSGVLGAAGSAAVAKFQVGELAVLAARACAGDKAREAMLVRIGEPQLGAGVRAFLAGDDPHAPWARPAGRGPR